MVVLDMVGEHWPGATDWHVVLAVRVRLSATPQQTIPDPEQSLAASQLKPAKGNSAVPAGQDVPWLTHTASPWLSRQQVCVFRLQGVPQAIGPPS
jgi:hypothetical protein